MHSHKQGASVSKANRGDEVITAQSKIHHLLSIPHSSSLRRKYALLRKWFWHLWVIPPSPLMKINAVMRRSHQVFSVFGVLKVWTMVMSFHWVSEGWLPTYLEKTGMICTSSQAMNGGRWHIFSLSIGYSANLRLNNMFSMSNLPFYFKATWQLNLQAVMSPAEMAAAASLVQYLFGFDTIVELRAMLL